MAESRRPAEESKALLIEAAVAIIREEGYAALSARRLAEKVGLKRQIVHYYFQTVDDLLLAVVRHYGEMGLAHFSKAVQDGDPLRVIWTTDEDASATSFAFMALATHRPDIRAEVRKYMDQFRKLQAEAVAQYFRVNDIDSDVPPIAAAILVQSIARTLAAEEAMDVTRGHAETTAWVKTWLHSLRGRPVQDRGANPRRAKRTPAKSSAKSSHK